MRQYLDITESERSRRRTEARRALYQRAASSKIRGEAMETAQERPAIVRPPQRLLSPAVPASVEAVAGLGRLASLPNEVVMMVLQHCTVRTLFKLQRVNRAAAMMVRLLPNFSYVANTAKGMLERALVKRLITILTFTGLRHLLMSNTCEKCGKEGSSFLITQVKVLCYECRAPPRIWVRGAKGRAKVPPKLNVIKR
ncbi:hypothetical protein DL766_010095 [Monosporascus sp. MC13-8B]|uniref:F-box domain-containing protein n=1 Tax=Monosporascus cannonballus TaxID=155416 RepID=A0ABY0GV57_9PEZI|nr:hypothetical protein DL762_008898 [Monosporascus cannonballus]RYP01670.1 hypothetical protein DL763_000059 [Monosporascus cannonballus]RYP10635.1 hypothetical protein DL766_010095 [Monosporascus sp. MC13-8B]